MSKTFADFLNNNPEFWDGHSDYPEAVKSIVDDWFFYRECCTNNDVKFSRMFGRKLDVLSGQFNDMYNKYLELYDIDPVQVEAIERTIERVKNSEINKIIERAIEESATNTKTLNTDTTKTGTETTATDATTTNALQDLKTLATSHTKTGNTTVTDDTTTTYNTSDTRTANLEHKKTGTENVDTTNTGTVGNSFSGSDTTYASDYPQSSPTLAFNDYVSSGAKKDTSNTSTRTDNTAGTHDTTFNTTDKDTGTDTMAKTGTVTVDNDNVTTHNTTDADTGTVTDAHTGTISDDVNTTTTHNTSVAETGTIADTTARTTSDNKNGTDTLTGSESETESTRRTGSAVDMFDKYFKLVKSNNVIDWLLDKLDVCFVQVFDEEEEANDSGSSADIAELQRKVNQLIAAVEELETSKQDVLTAGDNITIENNVISATGGGGGGVSGDYRKFSTYSQAAAYMDNTPGKAAYTTVDDRTPTPLPTSDTTGDLIEVTILNSHQISVEAQVMGTIYVAISGGTYANLFPENNPKLQAFYDAIVSGGGNEYYDVTAYNSDPEQQEKEWLSPETEVNPYYTDFTFEIQTDAFGMNNVLWCVNDNGDIKPLRTVM